MISSTKKCNFIYSFIQKIHIIFIRPSSLFLLYRGPLDLWDYGTHPQTHLGLNPANTACSFVILQARFGWESFFLSVSDPACWHRYCMSLDWCYCYVYCHITEGGVEKRGLTHLSSQDFLQSDSCLLQNPLLLFHFFQLPLDNLHTHQITLYCTVTTLLHSLNLVQRVLELFHRSKN